MQLQPFHICINIHIIPVHQKNKQTHSWTGSPRNAADKTKVMDILARPHL